MEKKNSHPYKIYSLKDALWHIFLYSALLSLIIVYIEHGLELYPIDQLNQFFKMWFYFTLLCTLVGMGLHHFIKDKTYGVTKIGRCPYCHSKIYTDRSHLCKCTECKRTISIRGGHFSKLI